MKSFLLLTFSIILIFTVESHALCIKVKKANLRAGPSTKKQVTWEVFKYMPLRKISKKGSWIKVKDFEGDTHWVFHTLVTSKFQCAVVKTDKANLRTGPGTNHAQAKDLPSAEKYMVFKVKKIKDKWAQITDTFGDSYWVYRSLIWIN